MLAAALESMPRLLLCDAQLSCLAASLNLTREIHACCGQGGLRRGYGGFRGGARGKDEGKYATLSTGCSSRGPTTIRAPMCAGLPIITSRVSPLCRGCKENSTYGLFRGIGALRSYFRLRVREKFG